MKSVFVAAMLLGLCACSGVSATTPPAASSRPEPALSSLSESAKPFDVTEHYPLFVDILRGDLFRLADIVALVRVIDQEDRVVGPDYVWRVSQVEIVDALKGPAFESIHQPGGAVAGRMDVFHDVQYLEVGREYLVFLKLSTIGDKIPSVEFFGNPAQLAFVRREAGYTNLAGTYSFNDSELADLALVPD